MSNINVHYAELKEKSNSLIESIKERQEQITQYFLEFIQLKNYKHLYEIKVRNDSSFLSIEFSKTSERFGRETTFTLSIPRDLLYSSSFELNEENFTLETEINYCSTIITGNEKVNLQTDFFIQTYTIINELNTIVSDKSSGLFNALKQYYFLNHKLNESLYEIHSKMRQLKNDKKEQVIKKVLDSLPYSKPVEEDVLSLLSNGSKLKLFKPNIVVEEDSLFAEQQEYTLNTFECEVYKVDRTYYFEGHDFVKKIGYSKCSKTDFLKLLSDVMVE